MQVVDIKEIAQYIPNNSVIAIEGFIGSGVAESIHHELGEYYQKTGQPNNLTLIHAAGIGDGKNKGMNHYAHAGMVKRVIGGHYAMAPMLNELINNNEIEAYNFPQGVISHMFRAAASKKIFYLTKVGLGTFVDPDYQGGKLNQKTTEDLVQKITLEQQEYLMYQIPKLDIAILRGTYADSDGNISFEHEPLTLEALAMATAVHNNGGKVIVQVEDIVEEKLNPKLIKIPGILVDIVVKPAQKEQHKQTYATQFNHALVSGGVLEKELAEVPMSQRKLIGRYSLDYIPTDAKVVNYGIGMPEVVAHVLKTEMPELAHKLTATIEPGTVGGVPLSGLDFGTALYPDATIDQCEMFDFYDGGGIDIAFLGMAECDEAGNINVSKFANKLAGAGGFINISQNTKHIVFCGTFTAGGLETRIENNELKIITEGRGQKFVKKVKQITFNGKLANKRGQVIHYVTERAIFKLTDEGLMLEAIARGIDLEKDILDKMAFVPQIATKLKVLDGKYFE